VPAHYVYGAQLGALLLHDPHWRGLLWAAATLVSVWAVADAFFLLRHKAGLRRHAAATILLLLLTVLVPLTVLLPMLRHAALLHLPVGFVRVATVALWAAPASFALWQLAGCAHNWFRAPPFCPLVALPATVAVTLWVLRPWGEGLDRSQLLALGAAGVGPSVIWLSVSAAVRRAAPHAGSAATAVLLGGCAAVAGAVLLPSLWLEVRLLVCVCSVSSCASHASELPGVSELTFDSRGPWFRSTR